MRLSVAPTTVVVVATATNVHLIEVDQFLIPFSIYASNCVCVCIIPQPVSFISFLCSRRSASYIAVDALCYERQSHFIRCHENMYSAVALFVCHYFSRTIVDYILLHFTTMFIFTLMLCVCWAAIESGRARQSQ